jgi:alkylated DNA repair dioxygenase AlkB
MHEYVDERTGFNVAVDRNYLDEDDQVFLFNDICENAVFGNMRYTKSGELHKRRLTCAYGSINHYGRVPKYGDLEVQPWSNLPSLEVIAEDLRDRLGEPFNVCIVQLYMNGGIGINPHRDREVPSGTTIAGVSLGQTRTMTFERRGTKIPVPLMSGALYLIRPPTNDVWTHSVDKDPSITEIRIGITFRTMPTDE